MRGSHERGREVKRNNIGVKGGGGSPKISTSNFVVTAFVIIQTAYQNAKKKIAFLTFRTLTDFLGEACPRTPYYFIMHQKAYLPH